MRLACDTFLIVTQEAFYRYPTRYYLLHSPQHSWGIRFFIQNALAAEYRKNNSKITHFYNNVNYNEVPIWAIFEILTIGDFGYLLSCLTIDMREKVSRLLGINLSRDPHRELLYKYVFALKDLRNAIAHNDMIYDTRFRKTNPSKPMKQCLILEMNMPYINFKTIGDYIILICYFYQRH